MELPLADGEAQLRTSLGTHAELTTARLWRGEVLVDWEPDDSAGGCLLRPALVRRLLALHARVEGANSPEVRVRADRRLLAALSRRHAELADRLGPTAELRLRLCFDDPDGAYTGGEETYGVGSAVLLRLTARVRVSPLPPGSGRTSPAPL
jgi:hypothetical protein